MVIVSFLSAYEDVKEDVVVARVGETLEAHDRLDVRLNVTVVPHEVVVELAKHYLKETEKEAQSHPVLSFATDEIEGGFSSPPGQNDIGDVVVSFGMASKMAKKSNTDVSEEVAALAAHGTLHLLGIHHS